MDWSGIGNLCVLVCILRAPKSSHCLFFAFSSSPIFETLFDNFHFDNVFCLMQIKNACLLVSFWDLQTNKMVNIYATHFFTQPNTTYLYFFLFHICHVRRVENGEWGRHNIFMASTKFMVHARSTHHWKDRLTNKDRQCKYIEANTNMHIRNQRYKQ